MTLLEARPRAGFLGQVRYAPSRKRSWTPARRRLAQTAVTEGEPSKLQRYAHIGIMAVGLITASIAWKYRNKFIGSVALGAGTGALGVGLAFLTLDLIGVRPAGETL